MRRSFSLVIALILISSVGVPALEPIPLQKAQTHIDDHGCVHFEATARMDVPLDELFDSFTRPERFLRHGDSYPSRVFLPSPVTVESLTENKWTIGWPSEKILEFELMGAGSVTKDTVIPKGWVKYEFDRFRHIVHRYDIGSTSSWTVSNPHSDSTYALSPLDNGSATLLQYTNLKCYPREAWGKLAPDRDQEWRLSGELESAQFEAQAIAEQRAKSPPTPSATPTCAPPTQTIPSATPTPFGSSF